MKYYGCPPSTKDAIGLGNVDNTSDADKPISIEGMAANSTGVKTGGVLSIGTPNTTFSISDGTGAVTVNHTGSPTHTPVTWSGKTNITATYVASGLVSYVAIDASGTVIQQLLPFTQTQSRSLILLGSLIHVNLTNLDAVNNFQDVILSPANMLQDISRSIGIFNVNGNLFSANGANLNLNKSVGKVYAIGSNWAVNALDPSNVALGSLTALTFQYRFQNGTNGATGIAINPDIYDLAGASTAVPNNKFTIQRIFSFVSNNVKIQPGQTVYNSLAEAKAAIQTEVFVTETSIADNGLLRGFLIVQEGTISLTNATSAFFYEAPKFGGASGVGGQSVSTLQNAYDNSTTPEILTDATRGALTLQRGSASDTDNVYEGKNGAGSTTFAVTGNGATTALTFNGVALTTAGSASAFLNGAGNYVTVTGGTGITRSVTITSGNITVGATTLTDYVVLVSGAHTVTLPTAVGNTNLYTVKNYHSASITVNTTSSQTMDGSTTASLTPDASLSFISDGTNWRIV